MPQHWTVCIDDTADQHRLKYVCAGSLFGSKDDWNRFNKEWRKALHETPRIEHFHGKEVHHLTGQFSQFKNKCIYPGKTGMDAACAKRARMQAVIKSSNLIGFGVGVLVPEYHRIRESLSRGREFMSEDPF